MLPPTISVPASLLCICLCTVGLYNMFYNLAFSSHTVPVMNLSMSKRLPGAWRNSSVVKNVCCSCRGPSFNSLQPRGSSQLSITLVSGVLPPSSDTSAPGTRAHMVQDLHASKTTHKNKISLKNTHTRPNFRDFCVRTHSPTVLVYVCVPPQFTYWNPYPQGDNIRKRSLWEVTQHKSTAFVNMINILVKGNWERIIPLHPLKLV